MTPRLFEVQGERWEVTGERVGFAFGVHIANEPDRWSAMFRCVSQPEWPPVPGYLSQCDPADVTEKELQEELREAIRKYRRRKSNEARRAVS